MNKYLSMTTFKIRNKNKQKFETNKNIQYERQIKYEAQSIKIHD